MDQLKASVTNPQLMISGFILIGIQLLFFMLRWKLIVDFYKKISFLKILKLNLISQFFNIFIPGGVGGDVVKALELSNSEQITKQSTLTTVVVDRVLGLYFMILFSTLFLFVEINQPIDVKKYFYTSLAMLLVSTLGLSFINKIIITFKKLTHKARFSIVTKIMDGLESIGRGFKSVSNFKTLSAIMCFSCR